MVAQRGKFPTSQLMNLACLKAGDLLDRLGLLVFSTTLFRTTVFKKSAVIVIYLLTYLLNYLKVLQCLKPKSTLWTLTQYTTHLSMSSSTSSWPVGDTVGYELFIWQPWTWGYIYKQHHWWDTWPTKAKMTWSFSIGLAEKYGYTVVAWTLYKAADSDYIIEQCARLKSICMFEAVVWHAGVS